MAGEKIKLSDIRAKYPELANAPDDQLLIALHQSQFKHVPAAQFFNSIDYDTQREKLLNEAASSGSWLDRARANVGAGLTTTAQGAKQLLPDFMTGGVSDEQVREKRALDKRLAQHTEGGGVLQTVGEAAPLLAIPGAGLIGGAAAGAAGGALQPVTSDESRGLNAVAGGVVGGTLGKVFPHAIGALQSGVQGLRKVIAGPEATVQRMLQEAAGRGPEALQAVQDYIAKLGPDSIPLSGSAAAKSPGLAQLEAGARVKRPGDFYPLDQQQGAAVFKKTLDATKEAPNVQALRNARRAEWESNWQTAMDVADPQVFAAEMPAFRANLDKALLSTESSNPAVRGVVNEIRSEMDRLGDNFTPGHLQQIRANLNARGHPMPQNAFQSAPRDSTAVNSLVDEMDNILNKTTSGAWDAVKGGYEASTKGVNAAKAAARVRDKYIDPSTGRVRGTALDPQGDVPLISEAGLGKALDSTRDRAGRELLSPEASGGLNEALGALREQGIVQRVKRTATAGGGSATAPNVVASEMFSRLPGGKTMQAAGEWLTDVPKREQLLADALRDPEVLRNYLSKEPSITTKAATFGGDVLERARIKAMLDAMRGYEPLANVGERAPRAFGTAAGVDIFGSGR